MPGFLNILFWRCSALPLPLISTAFGAVAEKGFWLCLILVHLDLRIDSMDTGTEVYKLPVGKHSEHVLMQFIAALSIIPLLRNYLEGILFCWGNEQNSM